MEKYTVSEELSTLSFDSILETSFNTPWYRLVQNFTQEGLESLRTTFKKNSEGRKELGLTKHEFKQAVCNMFGNNKYSEESELLFDNICKNNITIEWNDFLDFLIENINPKTSYPVNLHVDTIEAVPHMNRETVVKIVLIETDKYFCYAIASMHGRIGIYDGNLNFLTSYHVLMTREDLERKDDERRRKNRWITDAIFCEDIQMFFVANSTMNITIYEASGLKHEPYWLIIGTQEIIQCLAYKSIYKNKDSKFECIIFGAADNGDIFSFKFIQPEISILRRKHTEKITIFYWDELKFEKQYIRIKIYKQIHNFSVEQIEYNEKEDSILTCSKDPHASLVKKYLVTSKLPLIFKMKKGCNCFDFSNVLNIIITGSSDKVIRIWNLILVSNPIAILEGHEERLMDVVILENYHMIISISQDGILKLWEINENKCLQTVRIEYPVFNILGKLIEFGGKSIYQGPKRSTKYVAPKQENSLYKKYFGISEIEERPMIIEDHKNAPLSKWERSNILVSCCNYIAVVRVTFDDINIEKSNEMAVLPPPPLQNSVLIPASWQIQTEISLKERNNDVDDNLDAVIKSYDYIINKDLFDADGAKSNINYKIALLETKKMQMKNHVAKGAPYLALDLAPIKELKLADDLRIPNCRNIKNTVNHIQKILRDASMRDQVFSEHSSNRSLKSSRSSVVSLI